MFLITSKVDAAQEFPSLSSLWATICPQLLEETSQPLEDLGIDPAVNVLASSLHLNQARPVQLFDVVRYGGRRDPEIPAQLPHAFLHLLGIQIAGDARPTAPGQPYENLQAMGVRQRLKHLRKQPALCISTVRHISNYNALNLCVKLRVIIFLGWISAPAFQRPDQLSC